MRAFVAIALPPNIQRALVSLQQRLARQLRERRLDEAVRWTAGTNIHLTLRFLGEIDGDQQAQLAALLPAIAARHPAFDLHVGALGCFPNCHRPSVIWCGLLGASTVLGALQGDVERAAQAIGLPAEEKRFTPHLTIGRTQRNRTSDLAAAGQIIQQAAATSPPAGGEAGLFPVGEILLMRSELTRAGSVYTPLGVYPLRPGE